MSLRRKMFDEDMRAVQRDLGEVVGWNGKNYDAVVGDLSEGAALQLEGYELETSLSFTFRRSDFKAGLPATGQRVVYDGTSYMIGTVEKVPQGGAVVVNCVVP